jgi:hypothetical protein
VRAIGAPFTDADRADFLAGLRARLGVKFRHRGRSRVSLDCAGLALVTLKAMGRAVVDVRVYGKHPHREGLQAAVRANLGPPVADEPRVGDVVLMRYDGGPNGPIRHVAVITDHPLGGLGLIHACAGERRVIEQALDATRRAAIAEVYRP